MAIQPTRSPDVTRIPAQRVPILDERAEDMDLVSRDWYRFFQRLFILTGAGSDAATVVDLQQGPSFDGTPDALAELTKAFQGSLLGPAYTPQTPEVRYGSFASLVNQTAAVVNTAYPVAFATVNLSQGVYQPASTSQIVADRPGVYAIDFTAQVDKIGAGVANMFFWLAVNGTDVANSATQHAVQGATAETSIARNFMVQLAAGDYLEVKWSTSDITASLTTSAAAAPVPAIPSASLIVYKVA